MLKVQPETLLIQADMAKAKKAKDTTAVNYNAGRLQALYKKNGINPFAMLGGVLLTVPFQISMFFSLRSMANLPVPQFLVGGTAWFPDLTMADPTYILPVAACGATWLLGHVRPSFTAASYPIAALLGDGIRRTKRKLTLTSSLPSTR
jgi:membrane protein insertase Oxa1/YidC/SpoIIIJ